MGQGASSTPTTPILKAFTFNSIATALRGSVRKPYYQELGKHAAVQTYAGSSGQGHSEFTNFSLVNTVAYKRASSQVTATVTGTSPNRVFRSRVESTLEGLSILGGRIKADLIVSVLESVFNERFYPQERVPRISPFGSKFGNLVIDGQVQNPVLPPAFSVGQDAVESYFSQPFSKPLGNSTVFTPTITAAPFHKDGLGTVYFAEWVFVSPFQRERQTLVMLRLALGSLDGLSADACLASTDGSGIDP